MSNTDFHIVILDQGWIAGVPAEEDLYSHGHIRLTIMSRQIADENMEYGIADSALALLRTLESDHTKDHPVASRLIFHGCAVIPFMTCPIGLNWEVVHQAGSVRIDNVVQYPSVDESEAIHYPGVEAVLSFPAYRDEVVGFAGQAKAMYQGISKKIEDEFDAKQYQQFWQEYDARLAKFAGAT